MTFVRLFNAVDRSEIPNGNAYVMVSCEQVDADGNWIPSRIELVSSEQLRANLQNLCQSGDKFVIHCARNLWGILAEMGISMLSCEWVVL
jgi:hypothetical protein